MNIDVIKHIIKIRRGKYCANSYCIPEDLCNWQEAWLVLLAIVLISTSMFLAKKHASGEIARCSGLYGGREISTHCNLGKLMQLDKILAN